MRITEYKLTITCSVVGEDGDREKELIWRGNENVIIREKPNINEVESDDDLYDGYTYILIPMHILRKFVELCDEQ